MKTENITNPNPDLSLFTLSDLRTLTDRQEEPCITVLCPMVVKGDTGQNYIRFKNLIRQMEGELLSYGLSKKEAASFMEKPKGLLLDELFWEYQNKGMALYLSPSFYGIYSIPISVPETVIVENRFFIKPLLPLLSNDGRFFVLALSQKGCRLFEGTSQSFRKLNVEFPSINDFSGEEQQIQRHSVSSRPQDGRPMVHGQGSGKDERKDDIRWLFSRVDEKIGRFLKKERVPLILGGVPYLHPIYESANKYPHLIGGRLTVNTDSLKFEELHQRALTIIQPVFQDAQNKALERLKDLKAKGRTSTNLKDILHSAYFGGVDTLFTLREHTEWGLYEPKNDTMLLHDERQAGDEDLFDAACAMTLNNGGAVYVVDQKTLANFSPIAAIFRFPQKQNGNMP